MNELRIRHIPGKKRKSSTAIYESGDSADRVRSFRSCRAHWREIESVYPLIRGTRSRQRDDRDNDEDDEDRTIDRSGREREMETAGTLPADRPANQPASQPVDPIFFKRPAHSSRPDSLTIIKRKSFYSAVSFRLRSYFLPPVSTSSPFSFFFLPPTLLLSLPLFLFSLHFRTSMHLFFLSLLSSLSPLSIYRWSSPSCSDIVPGALQVILLSNYSHLPGKRRHCRRRTGWVSGREGERRASGQRTEELPT